MKRNFLRVLSAIALVILFFYIFWDFENRQGSVQLFSFPIGSLPRFKAKPLFLDRDGLDISNISIAQGIGAEITIGIDLNTVQYADIILDGKKIFRIVKNEPENTLYTYQPDGTFVEMNAPFHEFILTSDGGIKPLESSAMNGAVPDAQVTFSFALGKIPDSGVNRSMVAMVRQFQVDPKPVYIPLPYLRSFKPWLVEVETDKGKYTVNKNVFIWR